MWTSLFPEPEVLFRMSYEILNTLVAFRPCIGGGSGYRNTRIKMSGYFQSPFRQVLLDGLDTQDTVMKNRCGQQNARTALNRHLVEIL